VRLRRSQADRAPLEFVEQVLSEEKDDDQNKLREK
jgi:hypothetical protein